MTDARNASGCLGLILKLVGLATGRQAAQERLPYRRKVYLLSRGERAFFDVLLTASQDYHVFCMVRLADLLYIQKGTGEWQTHFNRIQSKHIDFVLCTKDTLSPILAIELDDKSHQRDDRRKRDEFINKAMQSAQLPLMRVRAASRYDAAKLANEIAAMAIRST